MDRGKLESSGWQRDIKAVMDRSVALFLLVVTAPLLVALAALVWAADGPPVLHREPRLGRGGRLFILRKFRTMTHGSGASVAPDNDPRILPVGRFLRRWRLDELPQLCNVLAGDMSLVGPRPLPRYHAATLPDEALGHLLIARPGITGPAALAFMGDDAVLGVQPNPEQVYLEKLLPAKVAEELEYLEQWSLWTDLRILAQTVARLWSPAAHRRSRARVAKLLETG